MSYLTLENGGITFSFEGHGIPEKPKRENKGKSLAAFPESYVVLDTETTGFDPVWDDIIEVAALKVQNGEIVDKFESFVNPGYQIDPYITEIHGITNDMLKTAPTLKDVLPVFLTFLGDSVIVAHNANFDINFIYDSSVSLGGNGIANDFVDTMRLSRRLFPEEKHHRLVDLVQRFNIAKEVKHRSMCDTVQTYKCYQYMKNYIAKNGISIESLFPKDRNRTGRALKAGEIKAETENFDTDTSIYGNCFVFTGTLERMKRKDAMQIVVNMGGSCGDNVTKKTNYLVLGNNDYCTTIRDGKSNKQKKAETLKLSGEDIEIISENVFYDMIEE